MSKAVLILTIFSFMSLMTQANEKSTVVENQNEVVWKCENKLYLKFDKEKYLETEPENHYENMIPEKMQFMHSPELLNAYPGLGEFLQENLVESNQHAPHKFKNKYNQWATVYVNNVIGSLSVFVYYDSLGDSNYFSGIFRCENLNK